MCTTHRSETSVLLSVLNQKYKLDFSGYAPLSFERRIQKVISQDNLTGVKDIITRLKLDSNYIDYLVSEITVNVTSLFRDPESWFALRNQLIDSNFKKKKAIKIWVAGCSTGDEVLSLNIILSELGLLNYAEVIATDIDSKAISVARKGIVKKTDFQLLEKAYVASGGQKELSFYLKKSNNDLIFNPTLNRETTFLQHNLISGAPLSNIDVIICRNVLIYFGQQLQNQVVKRFHNSSNKEAYLFLGKNESLDCLPSTDLYKLINSQEKIYVRCQGLHL